MTEHHSDFSNFQSAIEWPDLRPPTEAPTGPGNFEHITSFIPIDVWTKAVEIAPDCDDSPIEVELGARLTNAIQAINDPSFLKVIPQYVLGSYRYDFAIVRDGKLVALIECDGQEFHSTEKQLANDRAKDRLADKEGALIFRFSGSQIHRDCIGCVRTILHRVLARNHLSPEEWYGLNRLLAPRPHFLPDREVS